jgi:hypothetical protein
VTLTENKNSSVGVPGEEVKAFFVAPKYERKIRGILRLGWLAILFQLDSADYGNILKF